MAATSNAIASRVRIRFIASDGFVSAGIRWVTDSLFSHVEFGTPDGTWIGAHAGGGIQERAANYCNPKREYYYEIPCTAAQMATHLARIRAAIGTRYNLADIAGIALRIRRLTTPGHKMCAQFCTGELLAIFPAREVLNVLPEFTYLVTPEMLHLSPIFVGRLAWRIGR